MDPPTTTTTTIISTNLSSWFGDVETMVALANRAFKTLDWLQPDYIEFYNTVRALLSRRAQLSSLETVLRTHENEEESDANNFQARSKEAPEALARSKAEYKKPKTNTQTEKIKPVNQIPKPKK